MAILTEAAWSNSAKANALSADLFPCVSLQLLSVVYRAKRLSAHWVWGHLSFYKDLKLIQLFTAKYLEIQLSGNENKNIFIYMYVCMVFCQLLRFGAEHTPRQTPAVA